MAIWSFKNFFKKQEQQDESEKNVQEEFNKLFDDLDVYELSISFGSDILKFSEKISDEIWILRAKIMGKNGFIIPLVHVYDDSNLQENEFVIKVRNNIVSNGFVIPNETDAPQEIIDNLEKVCFDNIDDIFSVKLTQKYLDEFWFNRKANYIVADINCFYTVTDLKYIFTYLLKNGQSIKDFVFVLEKLCEFASLEKDKCYFRNEKRAAEYVFDELCGKNFELELQNRLN